MNITKKQKMVLQAIKQDPQAANDDALLLSLIWEAEGWDNTRSLYANLRRMTRPETISRRRRELFNLGLIEYTSIAEQNRTKAFTEERNQASNYEQTQWFQNPMGEL